MRKVLGTDGTDNTSAAKAYLLSAAASELMLPHLILIGEVGDPNALWLTDWPQALTWGPGTFVPAVVTVGEVESKIGLDTIGVDLYYSPDNRDVTTQNLDQVSPIVRAQLGLYESWRVRIWRVIMPTPGDVTTYGAFELFGGRLASFDLDHKGISWKVESWTAIFDQKIPANVIENTNLLASYAGARPPAGFSNIPRFSVAAGSDETVLLLDCTSSPGHIFDTDVFKNGYLMFDFPSESNPDETLGGHFSIVGSNASYDDGGTPRNKVTIFSPLPWAPTPGVDTCFLSAPYPVDASEGDDSEPTFPYVPAPESAA
jgi:hypothetical protein